MEKNTTKHKYLESEFLKTALYTKLPEFSSSLFYLDRDVNIDTKSQFRESKIQCNKFYFPKKENIIRENLVKMLFDEYLELANSNEKMILQLNKYSKFRKWLFCDKILIQSEKHLMAIIITHSNNIMHNIISGPATFIVVPPKIINYFKEFNSFKLDEKNDNNSINKIGNINNINIFVKYDLDNLILIGRDTKEINDSSTIIGECSIEITDKLIEWVGAIHSTENSKYKFELLNFITLEDMPLYKRLIYKLIKKLKLFKWTK